MEKSMNKSLWLVLHEHRHGQSTYHVRCDRMPTEEEVVEHCQIDFDPNREFITITELDLSDGVIDIP